MTWSGRQLSSYVDSDVTASYVYNESGVRTQKTVNGTTTEYFLSGSTILAEKTGSNVTWYLYDNLGTPVGYEHDGAKYWYITNLQGDALYVVNSAGTVIGSYTYSPYGAFTAVVDPSASSTASAAFSANHLTYRGYYYDNETGLYYLNARYYDPQVGRFISADSYASTGEGILGCNMFAYCGNNPVNHEDPTGELYPGEIHNVVVKIYSDTYMLNNEQIILYDANESGIWGRADLISNIGEVWEVKRDKVKQIERGKVQVAKYARNTWRKNPSQKLKVGNEIPALKPFQYRSGFTTYTVTTRYAGNGVIAYDYTQKTDWQAVGKVATAVVASIGTIIYTLYTKTRYLVDAYGYLM